MAHVEDSLIVFARAPVPGKAKTRLLPVFTAEEACEIHLALLGDVLERAMRAVAGSAHVTLAWSAPPGAVPEGVVPPGVAVETQEGADLGERMARAFQSHLKTGFRRVVVLGSDAPTLPADHVAASFEVLHRSPVVIGPAADGGYYLIGMSRLVLDAFRGVRWGSGEVLLATRARLRKSGTPFAELGVWHDVDTPEDVGRLWKELLRLKERRAPDLPPRTYRTLARLIPGRLPPSGAP